MENQTKSSTGKNNQILLNVPYSLDICMERLKKGYTVSYLANSIHHSEKFHGTQFNKIDNNRMGFRAVYRIQQGKRARSVFLSGVICSETSQSTRVTAQTEFSMRSMGCLVVFFSPLIILAFRPNLTLVAIAVYAVMMIIGYAVLANEYRSTAPEAIKALSNVLEGRAYGMNTWKQAHTKHNH
ncbi:MAG TPA: hypothetical protein VHP14_11135 [Anaerolineales bacterium]|nr:hypothetical protein [Anaerolineales bacterium]